MNYDESEDYADKVMKYEKIIKELREELNLKKARNDMERLTEQNKIYQSCEFMEDGTADYFNKLAEYEDTGFTPENIYNLHEIVNRQSNCIIRTGKRIEQLEDEHSQWQRESITDKSKLGLLRIWLAENELDMDDVICKIGEQVK